MNVSVSTDGSCPVRVAKGRSLRMLLIMGNWRGADARWAGALVGLSLILGSIQARERGVWGGICLTWNGLKEEELEKALKSYCLQPVTVHGPAAFPGKQVEACTPARHTCTPAHHTCTPAYLYTCTHQMQPLLCTPLLLPATPRPQRRRMERGLARSGGPTWLLSI